MSDELTTDTYELGKKCEVCNTALPDSFGNLLCPEHYEAHVKEQERLEALEESLKQGDINEWLTRPHNHGVWDTNYTENPEAPDKDQIQDNFNLFLKGGVMLWKPTRMMYEFIKNQMLESTKKHAQFNKHIWQPTVVDVGCGSGVGTNILSQEASFAWGIDKNALSTKFASQVFSRIKNGIYYSTQVSYDNIDIINTERADRDFMKFDVVVAIEVFEHIYDNEKFLHNCIKFFGKPNTVYWFSTPNRNNNIIRNDRPANGFHVRELTAEEYYTFLRRYFNNVEFFSAAGVPADVHTNHTPLLAKCSDPTI